MSATLDRLLAGTRADIDKLRAESADHARDASAIAEQMTEPTDLLHAMEDEERDLLAKLAALQGAIGNARAALADMQNQRDHHVREAEAAANAAEYYERTTLPHLAAMLADLPPAEALAATGLMPTEPAQVVDLVPHVGHDVVIRLRGGTKVAGHLLDVDREHARIRQPDGAVCTVAPADVREIQRVREIDPPPGLDPSAPLVVHADPFDPTAASDLPVTTPPVPSEPAGDLVAVGPPDQTMPDVGLNPRRLDPPPGAGHHSHAKPGLGSRITGGFKALLDKPEQADQQQGDGDA